MSRITRQIARAALLNEREVMAALRSSFAAASDDINGRIAYLRGREDLQNLQSIVYQLQYQQQLKRQVDAALKAMDTAKTVESYMRKCYRNGYLGTMFQIHRQGIPIIMPIAQEAMLKAFTNPQSTYKSVVEMTGFTNDRISNKVMMEISRGIAADMSYGQIARNIENQLGVGYRKSLLIARTEGHRVQQAGIFDAAEASKERGADVVKQWDATLDDVTRPHHQELDGQIVDIDEPFTTSDGLTAMCPGGFGDPSEDCNCRCSMLTRARWALDQTELDTLKERAAYYGLDKADSFAEFQRKYMQAASEGQDSTSMI